MQFSRCYIFESFRNNVAINCTLRRHTVLDFCWHQWPWMNLNAQFILKSALYGTHAWRIRMLWLSELKMRDCMKDALTVSDKNVANMNCDLFHCSIWGLYEFSPGFTAGKRRTGVEPLNLVMIYITHHLWDIFKMCGRLCVLLWKLLTAFWYKNRWPWFWQYIMFQNFIGHICRTYA